jgi:hypothetical protein
LPKRLHPQAKKALQEIYNAPTRTKALGAAQAFADAFSSFPKATSKVMDDLDVLLAFYDFPAEHAVHLRATNPIESTFSTVRRRTRVTRGAGSRKAALAMAYKLGHESVGYFLVVYDLGERLSGNEELTCLGHPACARRRAATPRLSHDLYASCPRVR